MKQITIHNTTTDGYKTIKWDQFVGEQVNVKYVKNKTESVVQDVLSFDKLDLRLQEQITSLRKESKEKFNIFHGWYEVGRWIFEGVDKNKNHILEQGKYESDMFTSEHISRIEQKDFVPALESLIDKVSDEDEKLVNTITLIHTHPGKNTPLSYSDAKIIDEIARVFKQKDSEIVQAYCFGPNKNEEDIIFRYRV